MSVKDEWKNTGKDLGKSFAGLGKTIVRSVKVGADKLLDEEPKDENGNVKPTNLKENWSKVGHSFGKSGKSFGKAVTETAKTVISKADEEFGEAEPEKPAEEEPEKEQPAEEQTAEEPAEEKTEE